MGVACRCGGLSDGRGVRLGGSLFSARGGAHSRCRRLAGGFLGAVCFAPYAMLAWQGASWGGIFCRLRRLPL